jgi:hypothetical protein
VAAERAAVERAYQATIGELKHQLAATLTDKEKLDAELYSFTRDLCNAADAALGTAQRIALEHVLRPNGGIAREDVLVMHERACEKRRTAGRLATAFNLNMML